MEIWKDIPEYEGHYQVSNLGRVKSLERIAFSDSGRKRNLSERIIKQQKNIKNGYFFVGLYKNGIRLIKKTHQLVAISFLNHKPVGHKIVVDHIDNDKSNNTLSNLQLISNRQNSTKDRLNGTSKHIGVHYCNKLQRWVSRILINKKSIYLGSFNNEYEASKAYKNKLKSIK